MSLTVFVVIVTNVIISILFKAITEICQTTTGGGSKDEFVADGVVNIAIFLALSAGLSILGGGGGEEVALATLEDGRQCIAGVKERVPNRRALRHGGIDIELGRRA